MNTKKLHSGSFSDTEPDPRQLKESFEALQRYWSLSYRDLKNPNSLSGKPVSKENGEFPDLLFSTGEGKKCIPSQKNEQDSDTQAFTQEEDEAPLCSQDGEEGEREFGKNPVYGDHSHDCSFTAHTHLMPEKIALFEDEKARQTEKHLFLPIQEQLDEILRSMIAFSSFHTRAEAKDTETLQGIHQEITHLSEKLDLLSRKYSSLALPIDHPSSGDFAIASAQGFLPSFPAEPFEAASTNPPDEELPSIQSLEEQLRCPPTSFSNQNLPLQQGEMQEKTHQPALEEGHLSSVSADFQESPLQEKPGPGEEGAVARLHEAEEQLHSSTDLFAKEDTLKDFQKPPSCTCASLQKDCDLKKIKKSFISFPQKSMPIFFMSSFFCLLSFFLISVFERQISESALSFEHLFNGFSRDVTKLLASSSPESLQGKQARFKRLDTLEHSPFLFRQNFAGAGSSKGLAQKASMTDRTDHQSRDFFSPTTLPGENGDSIPKAFFELATFFLEEKAFKMDAQKAAMWYMKSADLGFAPAQYQLGRMYAKGIGFSQNPDRARVWYERAAKQGNVQAMHDLGDLYASGVYQTSHRELAAYWFRQAAEFGLKDSQFNLGVLYANSSHEDHNLRESYKWFSLAAKQEDLDAAEKRDAIGKLLNPEYLEALRIAIEKWEAKPLNTQANFPLLCQNGLSCKK